MKLEHAHKLTRTVVETLSPACDRIIVAGSIRRSKPNPKDIEIVYIPSIFTERVDLFNYAQVPATESLITTLIHQRFWILDPDVKRNGPKYKRLLLPGQGEEGEDVVVELFRAALDNWGYILALRTGPGGFNKLWAAKPWVGGACPHDINLRGGYLWRNGKPVATPTECAFFAEMNLPHWEPHERSPAKLGKYLLERRTRTLTN